MDKEVKPKELIDLTIERLGRPAIKSPLCRAEQDFTNDNEKILLYSNLKDIKLDEVSGNASPMLEVAGPRNKIYFEPQKINCGIVTCGGLCPGLNDVIRSITLSLYWQYGIQNVFGFRYGYLGLTSKSPRKPLPLTPEIVKDIHLKGGDILSSSRGPRDINEIVDTLEKMKIGILFTIGGDGTLRGAAQIAEVIKQRGLKISIIGIPKTIDNDICGIEQSFGFSTAVETARGAIRGAHEEARGVWNGVGLVKLMGRDSGFIAAYGTLANSDVNFCFIPEVPLVLEGENGFLQSLEKRLDYKHHALVVVAEGVGKYLVDSQDEIGKDSSGNLKYPDIGVELKRKIIQYFKDQNKPVSVKYIDPSYMIRSMPTDSNDSAFCVMLAQNAVHAGISGRTNMVIGYWNQHFVHIPVSMAVRKRKAVDPSGYLWQAVLETTGQKC